MSTVDPRLTGAEREALAAKIKDAFYEARDQGRTMHQAAQDRRIAAAVERILSDRLEAVADDIARVERERVLAEVESREWAAAFLAEWVKPYFGDDALDAVACVQRAVLPLVASLRDGGAS